MKKKILMAVTFLLLVAGGAFAGNGIPATTDGTKPFTFKPSNNVSFYYDTDGTGGTATAQNYIVNTKNAAGNRVYSSSNNSSNVWYKEADSYKGQNVTATGVHITTAGYSDYSGWSSQ